MLAGRSTLNTEQLRDFGVYETVWMAFEKAEDRVLDVAKSSLGLITRRLHGTHMNG